MCISKASLQRSRWWDSVLAALLGLVGRGLGLGFYHSLIFLFHNGVGLWSGRVLVLVCPAACFARESLARNAQGETELIWWYVRVVGLAPGISVSWWARLHKAERMDGMDVSADSQVVCHVYFPTCPGPGPKLLI